MTSAFSQLKSSRKKTFESLNSELTKLKTNTQAKGPDERFWEPTVDKAGNGYAVLRFLPAPKGEDVPFVRLFSHGFKGPSGSWYIENSRSTIGENDPVGELNSRLWNSGTESDKDIARAQKRRLHFISNVYVEKDSGNPENEGKVFLYKYGKKIFDKLNDVMNPQFDDEEPINPFDPWEGASFKLKIRMVEGYRNYDKSEFGTPTALGTDEEIEKIWEQEHSLQEFIDPKNFKSYEELSAKLNRVLGNSSVPQNPKSVGESRAAPPPAGKTKNSPVEDEEDDLDSLLKDLTD